MVTAVLQQCGSCGHRHDEAGQEADPAVLAAGVLSAMVPPDCRLCGCDTFRVHHAEIDAGDQAAAREAGTWDVAPIIPAHIAHGLSTTLRGFEGEHHRRNGWDAPHKVGAVLAVKASPAQTAGIPAGYGMMGLLLRPLLLPQSFYEHAGGDPGQALLSAARAFTDRADLFDRWRRACGLDPGLPVLGWWSVAELSVRRADVPVGFDLRELTCADVDERLYSVVRSSRDNQVKDEYCQRARFVELCAPMIETGMVDAGPSGQLPVITEALLMLARVSRSEQELRRALHGLDLG